MITFKCGDWVHDHKTGSVYQVVGSHSPFVILIDSARETRLSLPKCLVHVGRNAALDEAARDYLHASRPYASKEGVRLAKELCDLAGRDYLTVPNTDALAKEILTP